MTAHTLPLENIRQYATSEVFQRGKRYYQQDAVGKLTLDGHTLKARVRGSFNYRVQVTLLEQDNTYTLKDARCSCPYNDTYDGLCKHVIAVLLKFHHANADEVIVKTRGATQKSDRNNIRAKLHNMSQEELLEVLEHFLSHYQDAIDVAAIYLQQKTLTQKTINTSTINTSTAARNTQKTDPQKPATTSAPATPAEPDIDTRPYCAMMERAASQPDTNQGRPIYQQAREVLEHVTPLLDAAAYVDAFKLTWDLLETFIDSAQNLDEDLIHDMLYTDVYGEEYYDVEEDESIVFADDELLTQFDQLLARAALGAQAQLSDDTRKASIEKLTAWEDSLDGEYAIVEFQRATYALATTFHASNDETRIYQDHAEAHLTHARDDYHDIALAFAKDTQGADAALEYAREHERGVRYLQILLERNDIDTVMAGYQDYVHDSDDILQLIELLEPRYSQHAATVIGYGVDYADALRQQRANYPYEIALIEGMPVYTLLEKLSEVAARLEAQSVHFRAARLLFRILPTLPTYQTLHRLSDANDWTSLRETLLGELKNPEQYDIPEYIIEILLYEKCFDDAITYVTTHSKPSQLLSPYGGSLNRRLMWPVMDAVTDTHSAWVIEHGSKHAEKIVSETQSSKYDDAVTSLEYVKRAYLASGKPQEWQTYVERLAEEHKRKRKFMRLLEPLR